MKGKRALAPAVSHWDWGVGRGPANDLKLAEGSSLAKASTTCSAFEGVGLGSARKVEGGQGGACGCVRADIAPFPNYCATLRPSYELEGE